MNLARDLEAQRKAREEAEKNRELQDRLRAESITAEQQAEAQKALDFQRAQEAERMAKEAAREAAEVKFSYNEFNQNTSQNFLLEKTGGGPSSSRSSILQRSG